MLRYPGLTDLEAFAVVCGMYKAEYMWPLLLEPSRRAEEAELSREAGENLLASFLCYCM